jgi:L-alanine-DL-glutamate epimerase-like enolase superfamily enzyme
MPPAVDGKLRAPDSPGLGVEIQLEELGEPFASCA